LTAIDKEIKWQFSATYIFFRILDGLLDFGSQRLQDSQLISFWRQVGAAVGVEQVIIYPPLYVWVLQELFRWPREEVWFEEL
jgi:hypothetical protein